MEIVKIAGIGIVALIIIMILKQYRPEFVIYVSLIARSYDSIFNYGQAFWNNYTT